MNQIRKLVAITVVAILFVVPSVTATTLFSFSDVSYAEDDVHLSIKGGIGIHMIVTKPANMNLTGNYTICGQGIILKGNVFNETGDFILPEGITNFEVWMGLPYVFLPITVTLSAGGKSLSKSGFTFMWITVLREM